MRVAGVLAGSGRYRSPASRHLLRPLAGAPLAVHSARALAGARDVLAADVAAVQLARRRVQVLAGEPIDRGLVSDDDFRRAEALLARSTSAR